LLTIIEHTVTAALDAADRRTAVASGVVAVITIFWVVTDHTPHAVSTSGAPTTVGASVSIGFIAVIALLALVEYAITASLECAGRGTAVAIDVVAIIAGLGVVTDMTHHTITAGGAAAAIGAGIGVGAIAVVALLALIGHTIAATLQRTDRRATVTDVLIAVIASFITFIVGAEITALNTVAAASMVASARAGVGIEIITVIAGFAFIKAPVSTDFNGATGRTTIAGGLIAVVAFLKAVLFGL
jgi:hypothetical protein